MVNTKNLLLPFTHGVNVYAIEQALQIAQQRNVQLIPLALIPIFPHNKATKVRLEHIQQAQDFLEAIRWKATKYNVRLECREVFTHDVIETIRLTFSELECDGILVFVDRNKKFLLHKEEVEHLIKKMGHDLYIIHLLSHKRTGLASLAWREFSQRLTGGKGQPGKLLSGGEALEKQTTRTI